MELEYGQSLEFNEPTLIKRFIGSLMKANK